MVRWRPAERVWFGLLLAVLLILPAAAQTGLPIPRFVSLNGGQVNVRTGPGFSYPLVWIYQRRGLPVEIVQEFDVWRKVRDIDGSEGWVHSSLLSGRRTGLVVGARRPLRVNPERSSGAFAILDPGIVGRLDSCAGDWCRMTVDRYSGWLTRDELWGVYPNETFD